MTKRILSLLTVLVLVFSLCLLNSFTPHSLAATKYNYIANGEKDILGFKISGITQKEGCNSIEICLNATKNIVEFNTHQSVMYNGKDYEAGSYEIDHCTNATFTYYADEGTTISPIVIYLTTIENTSCALEIRHCNDNGIVEKVNLTLSATFYADQASDLRENKENSSGTLVQEDVIISRPNTQPTEPEKPTEPIVPPTTEPPVTEPPVTEPEKPTEPPITEPPITEPEPPTEDIDPPVTEPPVTEPPLQDDPSIPDGEIDLPIIDPTPPTIPINPISPSDMPDNPNITKPVEKSGIMEFFKNINPIIAITITSIIAVLLLIVIVLIAILKKKNKEVDNTDTSEQPPVDAPPSGDVVATPIVPTNDILLESVESEPPEEYEAPIETEPETSIEVAPVTPADKKEDVVAQEDASIIEDDTLDNNMHDYDDVPIQIDTVVTATDEKILDIPDIDRKDEPEVILPDKYYHVITASIPESELQKLKDVLRENNTNMEEYKDIVK